MLLEPLEVFRRWQCVPSNSGEVDAHDFDSYLNIAHPSIHCLLALLLQLILLLIMFQPSSVRAGLQPGQVASLSQERKQPFAVALTPTANSEFPTHLTRVSLEAGEKSSRQMKNTATPHTHHKERLPDLVDQTCDTRVAPLEHQCLFKVFFLTLTAQGKPTWDKCTATQRETYSKHSPTASFIFCFVMQKQRGRKKKNTHTTHTHTLHFACTWVGAGSNQSQSHPLTHTNILTPLCFSHSPLFSCYFFLSPPPRLPALTCCLPPFSFAGRSGETKTQLEHQTISTFCHYWNTEYIQTNQPLD